MRLTELEPQWLLADPTCNGWSEHVTRSEANGIRFLCPKCFAEKCGPVGTHSIICWEPSAGPDRTPGPGRWTMQGDTFDALSLVAGSSSVALSGGCQAHFFIENGEIRMCP